MYDSLFPKSDYYKGGGLNTAFHYASISYEFFRVL